MGGYSNEKQEKVLIVSKLNGEYFLSEFNRVVYKNTKGYYVIFNNKKRYVEARDTTDYMGNPCSYIEVGADREKARETHRNLQMYGNPDGAFI